MKVLDIQVSWQKVCMKGIRIGKNIAQFEMLKPNICGKQRPGWPLDALSSPSARKNGMTRNTKIQLTPVQGEVIPVISSVHTSINNFDISSIFTSSIYLCHCLDRHVTIVFWKMYHPYAPWCWNIYQHLPHKWHKWLSHVHKCTSTMVRIWVSMFTNSNQISHPLCSMYSIFTYMTGPFFGG